LRSLREEGKPLEEIRSAFRQASEKKDSEIEKVLTEEQKEKFRRIREDRPWMPERKERPGPPVPGEAGSPDRPGE
jgi:Spy/CpxP family protein refolding chaperone